MKKRKFIKANTDKFMLLELIRSLRADIKRKDATIARLYIRLKEKTEELSNRGG